MIKLVREQGLDKFYTKPHISSECIDTLKEILLKNNTNLNFNTIIEPSAGSGSFSNLLEQNFPNSNVIAMDIEPKENTNIIKKDFLKWKPIVEKNILTIGNPPFGKSCSMAVKFFNKASDFSYIIAFIVPRTFRRIHIQNKLNLEYHILHDKDIPIKPCAFEPEMNVKCCFQIWIKNLKLKRKKIILPLIHSHFNFVKYGPKHKDGPFKGQPSPPKNSDFAIKAYGGKCGEIIQINLELLRPKSWHWIKCNIDPEIVINNFKKIDYSISKNTARQNSLGKGELILLYNNFVNSKTK